MSDRYERYGAATGILLVGLIILTFIIQPQPPDADATSQEVFNYVADHANALHFTQLLFGAVGLLFLWFIGTLRSLVGAAEGGQGRLATIAYGGGLVALVTLMVGFGLAATATLHPVTNDPDLTRALWDASLLIPAVGAPAIVVFFAANSISILRSRYLPAWLGWLGLAAAFFNAFGITPVYTDHGVFSSDGALGLFGGLLLFLIWVGATSIVLIRKLGEAGGGGGTSTEAPA
jgi:hypothetical protein